jgi:hypothetical protein
MTLYARYGMIKKITTATQYGTHKLRLFARKTIATTLTIAVIASAIASIA